MHLQRLTPRHGLGSMPKQVRRALLASRLDRAESTSTASRGTPESLDRERSPRPRRAKPRSVRGCGIPFGTTISGTSGHAVTHVLPPTCLNHVMRNLRSVKIVAAAAVLGLAACSSSSASPKTSAGATSPAPADTTTTTTTAPGRLLHWTNGVRLSRSSLRFATAATAFTRSRRRANTTGDPQGKHVSAGVTALDTTACAMR